MEAAEFGKYLKKLREFKGLNLTELSKASSVSQPYISQVENGKRGIPSAEVLKKLAGPLGVSPAELIVRAGLFTYDDWFQNNLDPSLNPDELDDLFIPEMLGFPSREDYLAELLKLREELTHSLKTRNVTYNGHLLTEQDKQRVLDMLKALFPDYAPKD